MPFRSYRSFFVHFLTFCVIEPPFGGLETTYDVHLGLIGKRVADFLLVLIELFSLGRTAEALRGIIGSKSAISFQRACLPKISGRRGRPHQPFSSEN